MSITFTKLFSSITESTIWVEPYPTRIVWVSMLAMCDRRGRIWASVPGLAKRAGVTLEECEAALERFQQPDKYSRTPDHDGRRIAPIDGGWQLLNYEKYRAMRDEEARLEYQREWDRTHRKKSESYKVVVNRPGPTQAEAEAEKTIPLASSATVVSAGGASPPPAAALLPDEVFDSLRGYCIGVRVKLDARGTAHLRQFIGEGLTEQQLRDAVGVARSHKPDPEVIPFAYLVPIIQDLRSGVLKPPEPVGKAAYAQAMANIAAKEAKRATH